MKSTTHDTPLLIIEKNSAKVEARKRASLRELGFQERQHLEDWIERYPEVLGEPLLSITTEFADFEMSNLRLDILAIDKVGKIVVIELKLNAERSLADLQAIRYASKLSSVKREDLVRYLAASKRITESEASARIQEFVEGEGDNDFSQPGFRPRIIIAAEKFDADLTTCVLWLRDFNIDITCVELAAYELSVGGSVAIVPRVIIPLPEAAQYLDRVREKKEAIEESQDKATFWQERHEAILSTFRDAKPGLCPSAPRHSWMHIEAGIKGVHFEILLQRSRIGISLDFELNDAAENVRRFDYFVSRKNDLQVIPSLEFQRERRGGRWCRIGYWMNYPEWNSDVASRAATAMSEMIDVFSPVVADLLLKEKTHELERLAST